jgi:hypothetical protein
MLQVCCQELSNYFIRTIDIKLNFINKDGKNLQLNMDCTTITDIILPSIAIFVGIFVPVWYTNRQIKIQQKIALLKERIEFKDKILTKIDEIYKIFQYFAGWSFLKENYLMEHECINEALNKEDAYIAHLINIPQNILEAVDKKAKSDKEKNLLDDKRYKQTYRIELKRQANDYLLKYNYVIFRIDNNACLNVIKNEKSYKIYSLDALYKECQEHFTTLESMINEAVEYVENIQKIISGVYGKDNNYDKTKSNINQYYEKNLKCENFIRDTPEVIKNIDKIKEEIETSFITHIKLEDKRWKLKSILKAITLFSVFKKMHCRVRMRKNVKTSNHTR